jgi:hypothetical protein
LGQIHEKRERGNTEMTTYTKLAADGSDLPADATGHQAVRVEHPLLAHPFIVTSMKAPKAMTHKQAKKWAESLDVYGWSWRLPGEEAAFIPDRFKYPATPKLYFPDLEENEWIWMDVVDAEIPSGCAWFVGLRGGYVDRGYRTDHYYVRAVRAGQ